MPFEFWRWQPESDYSRERADEFDSFQKKRDTGPLGFAQHAAQTAQQALGGFRARLDQLGGQAEQAQQFGQGLDVGQYLSPFKERLAELAGEAPGAIGRGLGAFQENVALPAKGIATSLAAAPFELGVSAVDQALGGPPISERSTTLSEILAPRLRPDGGEASAEETWRRFGQVGDWRYGGMDEARESLPGALRVPLEAAGIASEITNPAYGPVGNTMLGKPGAVGQMGRASEALQFAVDPLGQTIGRGALSGGIPAARALLRGEGAGEAAGAFGRGIQHSFGFGLDGEDVPRGASAALSDVELEGVVGRGADETGRQFIQTSAQAIQQAPIETVPLASLHLDPDRFQFRDTRTTNAAGVTRKYLGATTFNQNEAAPIKVWTDPADGLDYVIDGHHRFDIAQRDPATTAINVIRIPAENADQAKLVGALSNMLTSSAAPADAAYVIRSAGVTPEDLVDFGVSLTNREVQKAVDLAQAEPWILGQVRAGNFPEDAAATIGRVLPDPAQQAAAYKAIAESRNSLSNDEVSRLVNRVAQTGTASTTQQTLFGREEFTQSTFAEEARVENYIARQLRQLGADFGKVGQESVAGRLAEEGNVLNVERNRQIADEARQMRALFEGEGSGSQAKRTGLANQVGPVNDIIRRAALEIAQGGNERAIQQRAYEDVRGILETALHPGQGEGALDRGLAATGRSEPAGAGAAPEIAPTGRSLFDEPPVRGPEPEPVGRPAEPEPPAAVEAPPERLAGERPAEQPRFYGDQPVAQAFQNQIERAISDDRLDLVREDFTRAFTEGRLTRDEMTALKDLFVERSRQIRDLARARSTEAPPVEQPAAPTARDLEERVAGLETLRREIPDRDLGPSIAEVRGQLDALSPIERGRLRRRLDALEAATPPVRPETPTAPETVPEAPVWPEEAPAPPVGGTMAAPIQEVPRGPAPEGRPERGVEPVEPPVGPEAGAAEPGPAAGGAEYRDRAGRLEQRGGDFAGPRVVENRPAHAQPVPVERIAPDVRGHLDENQQQGVAKALAKLDEGKGFLLADGTGVGKTRQILAVAQDYASKGKKVLILSVNEAIGKPFAQKTPQISGSYLDDALTLFGEGSPFLPRLNDGSLPLRPGEIHISAYLEQPKNPRLTKLAAQVDRDTIVIFDEAHALKNSGLGGGEKPSGIARLGIEMAKKAGGTAYATATPADKPIHVEYLFSAGFLREGETVDQALRSLALEPSTKIENGVAKTTWRTKKLTPRDYAEITDPNELPIVKGKRALQERFDRMTAEGFMVGRSISLEGVTVRIRDVPLAPENENYLKGVYDFLAGQTPNANLYGHLRRVLEPFKVPAVVEEARAALDKGHQAVVFISRVNDSEIAKKVVVGRDAEGAPIFDREILDTTEGTAKVLLGELEKAGVPREQIATLYGGARDEGNLPVTARRAMEEFQSGQRKVLIATVESGGTGINLDSRADNPAPRTLIMMTPPFGGVPNVQALGRVWRRPTVAIPDIVYTLVPKPEGTVLPGSILEATRETPLGAFVDTWNRNIIMSKMRTLGAVVQGDFENLKLDVEDTELLAEVAKIRRTYETLGDDERALVDRILDRHADALPGAVDLATEFRLPLRQVDAIYPIVRERFRERRLASFLPDVRALVDELGRFPEPWELHRRLGLVWGEADELLDRVRAEREGAPPTPRVEEPRGSVPAEPEGGRGSDGGAVRPADEVGDAERVGVPAPVGRPEPVAPEPGGVAGPVPTAAPEPRRALPPPAGSAGPAPVAGGARPPAGTATSVAPPAPSPAGGSATPGGQAPPPAAPPAPVPPAGGVGGGPPPTPPTAGATPPTPSGGPPAGDPYREMVRDARRPRPDERDFSPRTLYRRFWEGAIDQLDFLKTAGRLPGITDVDARALRERWRDRGGILGAVETYVTRDVRDRVVGAAGGRDAFAAAAEDAATVLLYKRALDRAERGITNPRADAEPWLNDPAQLRAKIAEVERALTPERKAQIAAVERAYQDVGDELLAGQLRVGNLSPEEYKRIRDAGNYWVHFDVLDKLIEDRPGLPRPFQAIGSGVQRARGTTSDVDDPFIALLEYAKELKGKELRKELLNDTVTVFRPYLPVDTKTRVTHLSGREAERVAEQIEDTGEAVIYRANNAPQGIERGALYLKENGTWVRREIDPKVRELEHILRTDDAAIQGYVLKTLHATAQPLRLGAVVLNLGFLPANAVADMFQAFVVKGMLPLGPSHLRGIATALGVKTLPDNAVLARFLGETPQQRQDRLLRSHGGQSTFVSSGDRELRREDLAALLDARLGGAAGRILPAVGGAAGGGAIGAAANEEDRLSGAVGGAFAGAVGGRAVSRVRGRAVRAAGPGQVVTLDHWKEAVSGLHLPADVGKSVLDLVARPLIQAGEVIETATRYGVFDKVYRDSITAGLSVEQANRAAARASRVATVDFGAPGGKWTEEFNRAVPFLRATIEGNRTVLSALKDDPGARLRLAVLGGLAVPGLWWLNNYDEERTKLNRLVPKYVRDNEAYLILGSRENEHGKVEPVYARIPLRGIKPLIRPVEQLLDYALEHGDRDVRKGIEALLTPEGAAAGLKSLAETAVGLTPFKDPLSLTPSILRTPIELAANEDTFRRRPIEGLEMTGLPKEERATPFTTTTARLVSRASGLGADEARLSPAQIEHAVGGIAAGGGRSALQGVDVLLRAAGVRLPEVARDLENPAATDDPAARLARAPVVSRFLGTSRAGERERQREVADAGFRPETFAQVEQARRAARQAFDDLDREQARLDEKLRTIPGYTPQDWREERKALAQRRGQVMPSLQRAYPAVPQSPADWRRYYALLDRASPRDRLQLQLEQYRAIEPRDGPDGTPDWDGFFQARDAFLAGLPDEDRTAVRAELGRRATPVEREYQRALEVLREYNRIPRYRGLSVEDGEAVKELNGVASSIARASGMSFDQALRYAAQRQGVPVDTLSKALYVARLPRATNPERERFRAQHREIDIWFGNLPADLADELPVNPRAGLPAAPSGGDDGEGFGGFGGFGGFRGFSGFSGFAPPPPVGARR